MAQARGLQDETELVSDVKGRANSGVVLQFIMVAVAYLVAGKLGLRFATVHPSSTAIWAPSGIALSACLLLGRRIWPAIFAGAFLVNVTTAGSIATSIAIAAGNTLEALLGSYLVAHYANGSRVFDRTRDTFKFLLLAPLASTMVAATIGVGSLALAGYASPSQFGWMWLTWWLGDAGGDLVVAPFLILWAINPGLNWSVQQKREALLLLLTLLLTGTMIFGGWLPFGNQPYPPFPPSFLCFPILLWAAFRFGPRETATGAFLLSVIAVIGTIKGLGPLGPLNRNEGLLLLQTFLGWTGMLSTAVAAAISERRRLDETRSILAAIVDSSDEAILGINLDGRITSWNDSARRIFGFSAAEAVGKPLSIIIPPDKLAEHQNVVASLERGRGIAHFETVRRSKGGQDIDVSLTVSPIKSRDGQIVGASTIARDISGEKLARHQREELLNSEQAARAQAEKVLSMLRRLQIVTDIALPQLGLQELMTALLNRLRSALGADAAAILLVEPDGQHLSPTSSVGLREELRGGADLKIPIGQGIAGKIAVSPKGLIFDDLSKVEAITPFLRSQLSSLVGAPLRVDERVIGVVHVGTKQARKFTNDDLDLIHLVADRAASAIERTRLHEAQRLAREEAEEANRAKDEFLAMLGHELRNPLNAIVLAIRLLEHDGTTPDASARARAIIGRQARHVTRLIDDLLDVARVTAGRIVLLRRPTNLADCLSECLSALRETRQLERYTVEMRIDPVWVDADPDRLIQIVTNLLNNALKYTPAGGSVAISVYAEGADAVLQIKDNGVGIAASFLPRVFDLFARGETNGERATSGLGVGLTLVRRLVELHGGQVEAISDGLNRGSTFFVRFPRIPAVPTLVAAAPERLTKAAVRRRILVAEDNSDVRESLRDLLEMSNHEVFEAVDGPAAVKAALTLRPEVALIDIGLPGFDGYEVARQIRAGNAGDEPLLVALTGYAHSEDRQKADSAGFDEFLVKPVESRQLLQLIAGFGGPERQIDEPSRRSA